MSDSANPPAAELSDAAPTPRDGLPFLYVGCAAIALSFLLSWWDLTRYRVPEQRGVPPEKMAEIDKKLDDDGKKAYYDLVARYDRSWADNRAQFLDFYNDHFGINFETELRLQDARNFKSGTIYFRGWSTWTGWLGVLFVALILAAQFAPKFYPPIEPWAWGIPWAGAILFGLYTLMALGFFFSVPGPNGDGYSQGVSWGNYLAILGGGLATAGCVFEGLKSIDQGLAALKARKEASDDEEEDEEEPQAAPSPPKNRLQDW